jgi:hypothetical protein
MAYINFDPQDYFNTTLWTGDGNSTQNITGTGFNADWIWLKGRSGAGDHQLYDKVRGVQKMIISNGTNAESTNSIGLQTFGSDGFTMGSDMTGSGSTFVSWNWLANGTGSSNTDGSITSTVSANTTSGFSIVSYTGTGSNATVGHGLGATPKMIIVKRTSASDVWRVYHSSIGATKHLVLNTTAGDATGSNVWNDTEPTSSFFTVSTDTAVNASSANYIAYCFAEKKGFSKFGSYVGNGNADGTFIYTGMKPAFVLFKPSSATENWQIQDNKRPGYNPCDNIAPNNNSAEATTNDFVDLVSNGFKLRSATYSASGVTYIYMAFAENPLINSLGNPATAR